MKFTINKNDIIGVLANIQGITGRRSNLAITENVLIKTTASGIKLNATDLETGFEGTYPAEVESEGTIAINSRKLFEIVRDFPSDDILVNEVENRWIEIGNEKVLYHIVGMNPDEFPETPQIEEADVYEVDSMDFKKMIERTVFIAGAGDEKRAHIIGVYLERIIKDETKILRMITTDGSRLSKVDYVFDKEYEFKTGPGVLVPKKGLNDVGKFITSTGPIMLGVKKNHFTVRMENEAFIIRLFEGEFPKYDDIIQKYKGHEIKFDRQLFLMMLKRMSILSSDSYKGVVFNFSEDRLEITTTNPEIGESKEDMKIEFEGDPIKAAFNPRFFIEALNVIDDETVVLTIKDEEKPCFLEPEKDKRFLSVIMAMRI